MTITRMLGLRQLLGRPAPGSTADQLFNALTHSGPSYNSSFPAAPDGGDTELALSELEGRLARTTQRLERLAAELDQRHQRYVWTEQLRQDLLAIAHDTPTSVGE